jgi:hypothetical protein
VRAAQLPHHFWHSVGSARRHQTSIGVSDGRVDASQLRCKEDDLGGEGTID